MLAMRGRKTKVQKRYEIKEEGGCEIRGRDTGKKVKKARGKGRERVCVAKGKETERDGCI
jgi:hypothetical protein